MTSLVVAVSPKPNIDEPQFDQGTYSGRVKHFFTITNPINLFCSNAQLDQSKQIVENYRSGKIDKNLTVDDLWRAKHVYDSAFHPDTKEKMLLIGRMSAQVPMNMSITGCMMTFYKTTPAVIFWQWMNQSFNAVVNYTNRSGSNPIPVNQLLMSYVGATGGALATALCLNSLVKCQQTLTSTVPEEERLIIDLESCREHSPPLVGRLVPWVAVAAANCVNIPLMRLRELQNGITVLDGNGNKLGESIAAARSAITMVTISRIAMASSCMFFPPFIMNFLEKKIWYTKRPYINAPVQVALVGMFFLFATPMCCAIFPQKSSMPVSKLEPELREKLSKMPNPPSVVYYNKGL